MSTNRADLLLLGKVYWQRRVEFVWTQVSLDVGWQAGYKPNMPQHFNVYFVMQKDLGVRLGHFSLTLNLSHLK